MDRLAEIITAKANELFDETIRLRRHFHMYPELSFREYDTSDYICSYLDKLDIDYTAKLAGTGIIAWINGEKKAGGKTIALRAELDALPVKEATGLPWASRNEGLMHACGHDSHMAMLMSAIKISSDLRKEFAGKMVFIFQPGEEQAPGGAKKLMETGAFRDINPDLIIAQHVLPDLPSGMTGFRGGKYMASADELHITIKGRGGHAALPEKSSDQVLIGSELVIKLKEAANEYKTDEPMVLGIGSFIARGATNIIPDKVNIKGTVRTFDEKARKDILGIIAEICEKMEKKYRVKVELDIPEGYPVLVNDEKHVKMAVPMAKEINGEDMVTGLERRMGSEDFAHYSLEYPVVFFRTGIGAESKGLNGLHTPGFTMDEKALLTGLKTISYLGIRFTGI